MLRTIAIRLLSTATMGAMLGLSSSCSHSLPAPVDEFTSLGRNADYNSRPSPQESGLHIVSYLNRWRGVPHRYGGLDHNGIDCSGLVYRTYKDLYDMDLPRSTRYQSRYGHRIAPNSLQVGDLIFFKTGLKQRHVGIYVGNASFVHSSRSKGVTRTSLNNPYWAKRFWKAKRVAFSP